MARKLKAIVVDDDPFIINMIQDLCHDSSTVQITRAFENPKDFISQAPSLDFDIALLDIEMPEMEGLIVAQMLKHKPFIFITGADSKLRDALSLSPVDIVTKPILKDRLDRALGKAYELYMDKKEYEVFSVAESSRKVKLHLPDILLATTDTVDPRHKVVFLRGGERYTIMDCTIERLVEACPLLVQANKAEAVSLEIVNELEHDMATIKELAHKEAPKYVTLGRAFRKAFKEKLFYSK